LLQEIISILITVGISLGFTLFDLWRFPIYRNDPNIFWKYRIPQQTLLQVVLYVLAWWYGWNTALACFIFWWFGGCDCWFYFLGDSWLKREYNFWATENFAWMDWTPVGIFQYISKWEFSRDKIRINAITIWSQYVIGCWLAFACCFLKLLIP